MVQKWIMKDRSAVTLAFWVKKHVVKVIELMTSSPFRPRLRISLCGRANSDQSETLYILGILTHTLLSLKVPFFA